MVAAKVHEKGQDCKVSYGQIGADGARSHPIGQLPCSSVGPSACAGGLASSPTLWGFSQNRFFSSLHSQPRAAGSSKPQIWAAWPVWNPNSAWSAWEAWAAAGASLKTLTCLGLSGGNQGSCGAARIRFGAAEGGRSWQVRSRARQPLLGLSLPPCNPFPRCAVFTRGAPRESLVTLPH